VVELTYLSLHLGIDDSWADGEGRHIGLLCGQGGGQVIEDSLGGAYVWSVLSDILSTRIDSAGGCDGKL
jgi:hypothetical protein